MSRYYIGLSTSGHDPSFSVVNERGEVLFAEATERFLQDKRAWGCLPDHKGHLESFLQGLIESDPDAEFSVATSWKSVKADLPVEISSVLMPAYIGEWIRSLQAYVQRNAGVHARLVTKESVLSDIRHFDHHTCHAVSAVYSSPFDHAQCLVIDGEGEVGAASLFELKDGRLKRRWRSWGPGSLGTFYGVLTQLCGFSMVEGEEWKVMGLAAYGQPRPELMGLLSQLLVIENGRPMLAVDKELDKVMDTLWEHARQVDEPIMKAADMAASGQAVYSELVNQMLDTLPPAQNLILTGGCALNSSFNGTIMTHHNFSAVHIPSAPADDGNSLGAALLAWQEDSPGAVLPVRGFSPFLGSSVDLKQLTALLENSGLPSVELDSKAMVDFVAEKLAQGKVVGVMRGRAEFGPRALGNRSILADPRSPGMKTRINQIVKGREGYRPFAPVVPFDSMTKWFETVQSCPYMSFTLKWKDNVRHKVPAVVHEDGTGRVQTVTRDAYPWLYELTQAFKKITGIPVLLNTSFNVMGKPIVHSVNDAISVLHTTDLDAVLIENVYIEKPDK
jgi:carbamoyltransferase